jgi:hypothetical protein
MRGLWVTVSPELHPQSQQDLVAVGGGAIPFGCPVGSGVLACTYAGLAREQRLEAIEGWLAAAGEPVLLFDESHRAQCLGGRGSKTSRHVRHLQTRFPRARIVYSSATGATSVRSLLHMDRLGLWGEGSPYFRTAADFERTLTQAGLGAMEMLAVELRQRGLYISRQLDATHLHFETAVCPLTAAERRLYDRCAAAWRALPFRDAKHHQRFFRIFLTAAKVRRAVALAEEHLALGYSIVFCLQGTGESSARRGCADAGLGEMLKRTLLHNRPTPALAAEVAALTRALPLNPLDQLLLHFGPGRLAEITGRAYRLSRPPAAGQPPSFERRRLSNQDEQLAFMAGEKRLVVISQSGSSGISLHDSRLAHPGRRLQIFLEMPWNATTLVQQCGRVHRSDQRTTPKIVVLSTDVPGEVRFTATLQRRLQMLGALTQGDRRSVHFAQPASDHGDAVARQAMRQLLEQLVLRHLARCTQGPPSAAASPYVARRVLRGPSQKALLQALFAKLAHADFALPWAEVAGRSGERLEWRTRNALVPILGDVLLVVAPPPMASAASAEWVVFTPQDSESGRHLEWGDLQRLHGHTSPVPRVDAELRWRPETYHRFLAQCFTMAGGTLPPLRWSPALHDKFPAPFRRAAAELQRTRLPAPLQHAVCEYLCGYGDIPLRTLRQVGLLRQPPHLVTVEMAFNSMLGCDLRHQRLFFQQFADLCAEQRSLGKYDSCIEGIRYASLALVRQETLPGGMRLSLFQATAQDRTLSWERAQQLAAPRSAWRQRRSKRLVICAGGRTHSIAGHTMPAPDPRKYEPISLDAAAALWEPQRAGLRPPRTQLLLLSGSLLRWWAPLHQLAARQAAPVALKTLRISDGRLHHTGLRIPMHFEAALRREL